MDSDLDAAIQRRALKLQAEGKLSIDGRPIELKIGPNGKHVSHYALTKLALQMFANGSKDDRGDGRGAVETPRRNGVDT